jgi:sialic acid synthase SpsE
MYERRIVSIVTTVNIVGRPSSVIAEAGVNYNGSLDMALKLVDTASDAGADCVNFQTFKAD